jgi:hypothetical protein
VPTHLGDASKEGNDTHGRRHRRHRPESGRTFVRNAAHLTRRPPERGSNTSWPECRGTPAATRTAETNHLPAATTFFHLQHLPGRSRAVVPPLSPPDSCATPQPTNPDRARMGLDLGRIVIHQATSAAPPQQATVSTASRRLEGHHRSPAAAPLGHPRRRLLAAPSLTLRLAVCCRSHRRLQYERPSVTQLAGTATLGLVGPRRSAPSGRTPPRTALRASGKGKPAAVDTTRALPGGTRRRRLGRRGGGGGGGRSRVSPLGRAGATQERFLFERFI